MEGTRTLNRRRLLALAAAAALVVAAGAAFRPAANRMIAGAARRALEPGAAAGPGAGLSAGAITVTSLLPVVIEFSDVRLRDEGPYGLAPGAEAARMILVAPPLALARWGRHPVDLLFERPRLRIEIGRAAVAPAGGAAALPGGPQGLPPGSTVRVRDGSVDLAVPGVTVTCEGVGLDAGPEGERPIAGRLSCGRGRMTTPFGPVEALVGQAGFAWSPGRLRIDPLIFHGEGIDLAGRGEVDLPERQAARGSGAITLGLDLARLAPFLPEGAGPAGRAETRLDLSFAGIEVRLAGDLQAPAARLFGVEARDLRATVLWDGALRLDQVRASILGGELRGGLTIRPREGGFRGEAEVASARLDAAALLALAAWPGPPIRGVVTYGGRHTMDERGLVSLAGGGDLALTGAMQAPGAPPQPLAVTVRIAVEGRRVRLSAGRLTAGSTTADFEGEFDPATGLALQLRGATGAPGDLLPLFAPRASGRPGAAAGRRAALPPAPPGPLLPVRLVSREPAPAASPLDAIAAALGGRWEWDGAMVMDRRGLRFDGVVRARGLRWNDRPIGDFDADIRYAAERLTIERLVLRPEGGGAAAIAGAVDFRRAGRLDLAADLDAVGAPLLLALAGAEVTAEGSVSGRVEIEGTFADPEGRAAIAAEPLTIAGVPIEAVRGEVRWRGGVLAARDLEARLGPGRVTVDGGLALRAGASGPGIRIEARDLDLERLAPILGGVPVTGTISGAADLEGSAAAPGGRVRLAGRDLRVEGFGAGDLSLEADIEPGIPRAVARLRLAAPARGLTASGTLGLGGDWPIDLAVEVADMTMRGAEIAAGIPDEVALSLGGRATLAGPGVRPREIEGAIRLLRAGIAAGAATATSEQPVEAIMKDGRLEVRPAVLSGPGTRIDFEGGLDLDPLGSVRLDARGRFDLALLRTLVHGLQAEGQGEIALAVTGLRRDPAFRGSLAMRAPHIRYGDLPFPIDDLDADIAFDGIGARIERLRFEAGGGPVEGSGEVLIGKSGVTRGLAAILAADIALSGRGVRAEFPPGFRSLSDADLRLVYDPTGAELSGAIRFVRGVYGRDFRIESSILRGRGVSIFDLGEPSGPLADLRLGLALGADEQIWVRNDFGRIEGQVDLKVTGTAGRPSVAGRITALDGSTIDFNRVRYRVVSGTIDFNDPEVVNPYFNLNAETSVGEYSVTLRVEGTADDFRYDLGSNPSLPQADIVALLITGQPPSGIGSGTGAFTADNVSAYLAGQFTQEVGSRFLGRVAPDVIAIDPLSVTAQDESATRVTLAKQITPDLRVTYSDLLGGNAGASYQLDYTLARNIGLTSMRDTDGSIGGDLRFIVPGRLPSLPGGAAADPGIVNPRIRGLRVEGDPVFEEKRILRRLRLEPGDPRDRARINDRVERLLDLYRREGHLAAEVEVDETPAGEGLVDVVVHARAGPRIDLEIEGVRRTRDLRAAIEPLWQQSLFPEDTLETSRARLEEILVDDGWRRAAVAAEMPAAPEGTLRARFTVAPGPRARAEAIRFEGLRQVRAAEIEDLLTSDTDSALRRGIVIGQRLRADAAAVQEFLLERGFPEAAVAPPSVDLDPSGSRAIVTFTVREGPRVSVRVVRFEGRSEMPEDRLVAAAALPEGVPFTHTAIDEAAARIRKAYDASGWPGARVRWEATPVEAVPAAAGEDPERDDAGEAAAGERDIVFAIEPGSRQSIGPIAIAGNVITDEDVIRRTLPVAPYDPLSRADLSKSQTRLYRLGVFRSVDIRPDPIPEPAAPPDTPLAPPAAAAGEPIERPLTVVVREAAPIRQSYGIGYDSEEKIRGLYEIAHRNLFGTARYLGLQLRGSDLEYGASLVFREQGVLGGRYDLLGTAFGIDEERPAFAGRTVGVAAQLSRDITRATRVKYRYTLKDVNLSDVTVDYTGTVLRLASLAAAGVHDTRDSPFDPGTGHYFALEAQGYGEAIGSDAQFAKIYAQAYGFRRLGRRAVWAQAVRAGAAPTFGRSKSDPATTGDLLSGVPQSERFFAGGDTTMRGFGRDLVGPIDDRGDPIGGEVLFIVNEELRFPIWRQLHAAVFMDVGNVYRTVGDFTFRDLRECAGAGLRLMTPIGPFRMEYSVVLDRRDGEDPGRFYISIGQAF